MDDLMDAMSSWRGRPKSAICIEYVLIPGVNDESSHRDEVCDDLRTLRGSLSIIPYNPCRPSPWPAPTEGRDVMAACGRLGNLKIRARRRVADGTRVGLALGSVELH